MTDEQVEKIIKSNMMLQMNLAGIRADFEEALQRTWVGLTDAELAEFSNMKLGNYDLCLEVEAKLKEKNA